MQINTVNFDSAKITEWLGVYLLISRRFLIYLLKDYFNGTGLFWSGFCSMSVRGGGGNYRSCRWLLFAIFLSSWFRRNSIIVITYWQLIFGLVPITTVRIPLLLAGY
jgi:hypothetical protein